jgi:prephenate dehydrogenase
MRKPLFRKITIVGVGLLGGSIGMAAKKQNMSREVCGYFRDKKKIAPAVRRGAIDTGTDNFARAAAHSDLIILCSPVEDIKAKLKELKRLKITQTLITDVGSTKAEIIRAAKGLTFVGSHPLAGSEQSGVAYGRADLFKGSVCIVTPDRAPRASVRAVCRFWKALGGRVITLTARQHDATLAFTSHLPHAVAYALAAVMPGHCEQFAAGGLKDTTRIALSHPEVWSDIFLSNRGHVLKSLQVFEQSLKRLRSAVAAQDRKTLENFLACGRNKRRQILS